MMTNNTYLYHFFPEERRVILKLTEEDMKKDLQNEGSGQNNNVETESLEDKLRHRESFSTKEQVKMDRQVFSSLDRAGKIQYLVDYYKWVPIAIAAIAVVIAIISTSVRNAGKHNAFQAILIDVVAMENISAESNGTSRLEADLKALMLPEGSKDDIVIDTAYYTQNGALSYDSGMMESVRMAAGELDVEIMPRFLYDFYCGTSVSEDAAAVFADTAEYESTVDDIYNSDRKITDRFLPLKDLMGEEFVTAHENEILPGGCGLDLGVDNAILASYDIYGKKADEPMVLCVCVNAPHPEETAAFIKFLGFE